jgi:hypothetical protein
VKTKKHILLFVMTFSLACQFLMPRVSGTVISNCAEVVAAVAGLQPEDIPDHLMETGVKRGDEFDANQYFEALPHLSMHAGTVLDYVYQNDDLGAYPLLYSRPADQAPYASAADIPDNTQLPDFREFVEVVDVEQGYFEYAALDIMADQFYLYWHANYNDDEIVCDRREVDEIITRVNAGDFGAEMNVVQQARARAMKNIEPVVRLGENSATVQFTTFTKWGGFYRETYTIDRSFPHTIRDLQQQNLVRYDCGVAF